MAGGVLLAILPGSWLPTILSDLAHSLETSNVRAFIGTIGLYVLFVVITRALLRRVASIKS